MLKDLKGRQLTVCNASLQRGILGMASLKQVVLTKKMPLDFVFQNYLLNSPSMLKTGRDRS